MDIKYEEFISSDYTAVALGFFDGVHLGHQSVIKETVKQKEKGLTSCVFTFEKHPSNYLSDKTVPYIIDNASKRKIIEKLGVDVLIEADFKKIKDFSAEEFVRIILKERLKAKMVFCGFNFTFGKDGEADVNMLRGLCDKYGIKAYVLSSVTDKEGQDISSSLIRAYIENGEIEKANELLGRNLSYTLKIVKGNQLGRTWGYPTANQILSSDFVQPKYGVYVSAVSFCGCDTYAVTNVGVKPTVGLYGPIIESYMPFYKGCDIYGETMTTELLHFIRAEEKFKNTDLLRKQIEKDKESFDEFLNEKISKTKSDKYD